MGSQVHNSPKSQTRMTALTEALKEQEDRLLPCVHCGFCLPACPTYVRLGDENDSPRGRLHLMKAVVEGRMAPKSRAFQTHIDRCLGCRACEPVCPSGVEYGLLLESAREVASNAGPSITIGKLLMSIVGHSFWSQYFLGFARMLRWTALPQVVARIIPSVPALHPIRFGLAMVAATSATNLKNSTSESFKKDDDDDNLAMQPKARVALLDGCVQSSLFSRVNRATERLLKVNGYEVVTITGQGCCGALHAHGGANKSAQKLAIVNLNAFDTNHFDYIATNSAGCGLALKEYGHLLEKDPKYSKVAKTFSAKVRDISEILTMSDDGPKVGGEIRLKVTYDAACHLCHGQDLLAEPKALLKAIPNLEIVDLPREEECCGGAGIYGITHGDLGMSIGQDKVNSVIQTHADLVTTANPGCIMQIGAGLILAGSTIKVQHPIELLDESYRRAGYYAD